MKKGDLFVFTFVIDWKTYHGFISIFEDTNPLHTDDQFAREKGFAEKVMHGNILNGFLSYFIGELLPLKNVIIHSQSIQYKNPIYLDDELLFEAKVEEVFESVGAVELTYVFRNAKRNQVSAKGKIQIGILLNKD
jgi:3-hydroxybutyryl-CoA dehydratase